MWNVHGGINTIAQIHHHIYCATFKKTLIFRCYRIPIFGFWKQLLWKTDFSNSVTPDGHIRSREKNKSNILSLFLIHWKYVLLNGSLFSSYETTIDIPARIGRNYRNYLKLVRALRRCKTSSNSNFPPFKEPRNIASRPGCKLHKIEKDQENVENGKQTL